MESAMSKLSRTIRLAGVVILCVVCCAPVFSESTDSEIAAGALLRRVIASELRAEAEDHSHWKYESREKVDGKFQEKLVIETSAGDLEQIQSINGVPLSPEAQQRQNERIAKLVRDPDERRKHQHEAAEDAERTRHLLKILPDAVIASYGERRGDQVQICFQPNPAFHPSSHEDSVFHAMEGSIWIDRRANRLAEISGHLMRTVKFGGGLLGHLDKGGEFHVRQAEVAPGHWEMTLLRVNMQGKALFFKTIAVQQDETHDHFDRVPDNLSLLQAANDLKEPRPAGPEAEQTRAAR